MSGNGVAMTKPTPKPKKPRRKSAAEQKLAAVLADLAPLLAYLQSGWLGPVQGNYQRLKRFVEGK